MNCFENGEVARIVKLKSIKPEIVGFCNDTLYIRSNLKYRPLYSVSFPDLKLNEIFSFSGIADRDNLFFLRNCYYDTDGSIYIPVRPEYKETPHFLHVLGKEVLELCTIPDEYRIRDDQYSLECGYAYEAEEIVKTFPDGTRETVELSKAYRRSIIPAYHGLLIHNERCHTGGDMLYYIDESGELITLFSIPQLDSTSAVTVDGSNVYLSFKRWEEWGEIGMRRYENDTLEGTYRISLEDYSVKKISDSIYDGLFILDDTGIYACDEDCSIYKLDFDGNVIEKIMVIKTSR